MITTGLRLGAATAAWLFAGCVVVQVFLVGLGLFEAGTYLGTHAAFGTSIGILPVILVLLVIAGRCPVWLFGLTALLLGLSALQFIFVHYGPGSIRALHLVNAFALLGLALLVGGRARTLARRSSGTATVMAGAPERGSGSPIART